MSEEVKFDLFGFLNREQIDFEDWVEAAYCFVDEGESPSIFNVFDYMFTHTDLLLETLVHTIKHDDQGYVLFSRLEGGQPKEFSIRRWYLEYCKAENCEENEESIDKFLDFMVDEEEKEYRCFFDSFLEFAIGEAVQSFAPKVKETLQKLNLPFTEE
jgi:hypothetical protein